MKLFKITLIAGFFVLFFSITSCNAVCTDPCTTIQLGKNRCNGNYLQTCQYSSIEKCNKWLNTFLCVYGCNSLTNACNSSSPCVPNCNCAADTCIGSTCANSCNTGTCAGTKYCGSGPQCTSTCSTKGATRCKDSNVRQTCDDYSNPKDGCLEWGGNYGCASTIDCQKGSCTNNKCVYKTINCNDNNLCTSDGCSGSSCTHTSLTGGSCDDGNDCTKNDICNKGNCSGTKITCGDCTKCSGGSCVADNSKDGKSCTIGLANLETAPYSVKLASVILAQTEKGTCSSGSCIKKDECVGVKNGEKSCGSKTKIGNTEVYHMVCIDEVCVDCGTSSMNKGDGACMYCAMNSARKAQWFAQKSGNACKTSSGKTGFCNLGVCYEKNCKNLGRSEGTCGTAKDGNLSCCLAGEYCCGGSNGGQTGKEVCCKIGPDASNPIEKCSYMFGVGSFCNPQVCTTDKPKLCPAKKWSTCCSNDASCVTVGDFAYCGKSKCDSNTEEVCSNASSGGEFCCKKGECKVQYGYPQCVPKKDTCEASGGTLCSESNPVFCCKNGAQLCLTHPQGYPRCAYIKNPQGNPSYSPSFSMYMVRNSNDFALDGTAYVITPHITLSKNATITLNYAIYSGVKNLETYKYEEQANVLSICANSVSNSASKNINADGGTIKLGDEITIDIPAGAITDDTRFTITKYNLSNCDGSNNRPTFFDAGSFMSTIGVYNPSISKFYLRNSNTAGNADTSFLYGAGGAGWFPLTGDWNGDGTDTVGLYDPSSSKFMLRNTNCPAYGACYADMVLTYGAGGKGWLAIAGDWNGDGTDTIGLYDPSSSKFMLRNSNSCPTSGGGCYADMAFTYGMANAGWKPLAGDWNGDGTDTIGLYDPSTGKFMLRNSNACPSSGGCYSDISFNYGIGNAGWLPLVGDWNGDKTDTVAVYDPSDSKFFLKNSNTGGYADITFNYGSGSSGWQPIAGVWENGSLALGEINTDKASFFQGVKNMSASVFGAITGFFRGIFSIFFR